MKRKTKVLSLLALAPLAWASPAHAETEREIRDAPSLDELTERRQQERARERAPQEVPGVQRADQVESSVLGSPSILNNALILGDGRIWTVLPRGAILHAPDLGRSSFAMEATGRLATWTEFEAANRTRVQSYVVRESHLNGRDEIPEALQQQWSRSNRMIVSVFRGNPVALPTRKHEEEAPTHPAGGSPDIDITTPDTDDK